MIFKYHSIRVDHERTQHGQVPASTEEIDEFGYYICRFQCGKTYKRKPARNRHERDHHSENEQQEDSETVNEDSEDLVQDEHAAAGFEGKEHGVHNYHRTRLTFGLLMMCFSDSVKEGDSGRFLKFLKVAGLILHSYGRVKYAYVVLLFLAKIIYMPF